MTEEADRDDPVATGPEPAIPSTVAMPPAPSGSSGSSGLPVPRGAGSDQAPEVDPHDGAQPADDWWSILDALDARRQEALTERDPAVLADYLVPGSPAWRTDSDLIAELRSQGLRPVGLVTHLIAIEEVEVGSAAADSDVVGPSSEEGDASHGAVAGPAMDRATIVLVDQRSGYRLVDAAGAVVQVVASPGTQRWEVTLGRVSGSPPGPARSGVPGIDEQPYSDRLSDEQPHFEGGEAGWRITEAIPVA